MKTYNQTNFFKHTFCEFQEVDDINFIDKPCYKSKSESLYHYTKEGVYRKSNHWGRVANCRWKLISSNNYKNQQTVIGFAKWSDFYPIHSSEKNFFININFQEKTVQIQPKNKNSNHYLFTFSEAKKRQKQIQHLLKNDKWATYYNLEILEIKCKVITAFINSDKSLQEIKRSFK